MRQLILGFRQGTDGRICRIFWQSAVMLPGCPCAVRAERLSNLLLNALTARPKKALYCSFTSVAVLREGHGSNQTSFTSTRVRRGNDWRACASLSRRDLPQYHLAHAP